MSPRIRLRGIVVSWIILAFGQRVYVPHASLVFVILSYLRFSFSYLLYLPVYLKHLDVRNASVGQVLLYARHPGKLVGTLLSIFMCIDGEVTFVSQSKCSITT